MLVPLLYDLVLLAACIAAFTRGGPAEKTGALVMLTSTAITFMMAGKVDLLFAAVSLRLVLIDAITFIAFVLITLRSRKFWPLWASALQLLTVFANFAPLLQVRLKGLAYALNEQIWAWPILAIILTVSLLPTRQNPTSNSID